MYYIYLSVRHSRVPCPPSSIYALVLLIEANGIRVFSFIVPVDQVAHSRRPIVFGASAATTDKKLRARI